MRTIRDECIHGTCYNDAVSDRYCWKHLDLDIILRTALDNGATVGMQLAEDYGYKFIVDGVDILETTRYEGQGIPHEHLEGALGLEHATERAKEKIRSILDSSRRYEGEEG